LTHSSEPEPSKIKLAAVLYGVFVAVAFIWGLIAGRPVPVVDSEGGSTWIHVGLGAAIGLALGLLVVGLSRLMARHLTWAQNLYRWFAEVLGPLSQRDVFYLALLSSIGEEILFRGAMQPTIGLWITTLIFGLLHIPPKLQLWPWTLMAALLGLLFGLLTLWSGNIAGAVLAHFIINMLNLRQIARFYSPRAMQENLPAAPPPSSMEQHEEKYNDSSGASADGSDLSLEGR
jgi:membrane protease YdiL (CAAX protease family)